MRVSSQHPHSPAADQSPHAPHASPSLRFSSRVSPLSAPPASSYVTAARLALTCAQAMPMLAAIRWAARPAPGISADAMEAEDNLPRQKDVAERQAALVVSQATLAASPMLLNPPAANNLRWLSQGFQLVLGSGFFGMYQHAGALRALAALGLHEHIYEFCGLSSGAITSALYATLGPDEMAKSLLNLTLLDFLDLSPSHFVREGALCAGRAVERKIAHDTGRFGCQRLEDAPGGKLRIAVFDGFAGKTFWHTEGPLGQTVARSAALPVLFANTGFLDGGWVDHHGYTALRPSERALSLRINTGTEPDTMQKLVQRPTALFNVSEDPEHKTVCFQPTQKIDPSTFLFDIDFRKDKLIHIMQESEQLMTWWLLQPEAA